MNSSMDLLDEDVAQPPQHLFSDYIEMSYLGFVILVGTPSNIFILHRLIAELKRTPKDSVKAGFLILKINLNISDLLLLLVLALGKFLWLITYQWAGGMVLCKLFNFLSMIALYISSNIVVCIALDRLRNVLGASKIRRGKANSSAVTFLVCTSWIMAVLWSVPQLYVWETLDVFPYVPGGWTQCSDIWSIHRFKMFTYNMTENSNDILLHEYSQNFYNISHLFLVFWGPLMILIISYVIIAVRLMQYSLKAPCQPNNGVRTDFASGVENSISMQQLENTATTTTVTVDRRSSTRLSIALRRSWDRTCNEQAPPLLMSQRIGTLPIANFFMKRRGTAEAAVKVPAWRRQLRSKVFRTTLLVVIAHFLFWFPYNFQAITQYVSTPLYQELSDHANIFKDLQILITLINPFLYGFTH